MEHVVDEQLNVAASAQCVAESSRDERSLSASGLVLSP